VDISQHLISFQCFHRIKSGFPFGNPGVQKDVANTTMGLDFEHMIKARAHKGGVRIGKTPKKLSGICCP
jgi:hypothetical protein